MPVFDPCAADITSDRMTKAVACAIVYDELMDRATYRSIGLVQPRSPIAAQK
jgi:hypothetical protein